jgi:hypothetical protein
MTEPSGHALAGGHEQIAETRQTYDLIAAEFARRNPVAAAEVAGRLDELAASVPAGSVVADIGCGPGRDVMMLRARGLHAAGIDLSLGSSGPEMFPGSSRPICASCRCGPARCTASGAGPRSCTCLAR